MANEKIRFYKKFNRISAAKRLLICLLIGFSVYFFIPYSKIDLNRHLLFSWDIFSLSMIIFSWITFLTASPIEIREVARIQDESRTIIFIIVVISTFTSLLAVVLLITSHAPGNISNKVPLVFAIAGMAFSWMLVHTIFTLRYAHLFYGDSPTKPDIHAGGLDFPGNEKPDYIDFAYFSFVIGMTFQVSDIEISSRRIRRLALLHGLLAFGFNTIIVALTINVIAGLQK